MIRYVIMKMINPRILYEIYGRSCYRCKGLLVIDRIPIDSVGDGDCWSLRCINCGNVILIDKISKINRKE